MQREHYNPKPIDDSLSVYVFETLLENLDSDKNIFLKSEYDYLSKYKYKLDDYLNSNDCSFFADFASTYKKALDFKEQYDSVRDSIFKIENAKVIAEAEVKYRVAEKEAKLINAEKQQQKSQFIITVILIIAFGLLLVSWMIFRNQKTFKLLGLQKQLGRQN